MDPFYKDIEDVFERLDKKREGISYHKIVDHLCISPIYGEEDHLKLSKRVLAYLNRCVKKNELYERVKNGKKYKGKISYKSGVYRKKKVKEENSLITILPENTSLDIEQSDLFGGKVKPLKKPAFIDISRQKVSSEDATPAHIGKGGEYAVMSELLYNGYYTSQSSVDDGVDIVAHKDRNVFFIQVKTTIVKNNSFDFKIKKESFDRYNRGGMFYIFVLRFSENKKAVSLYIIFPTNLIEHYYKNGMITLSKQEYNVKFRVSGTRVLLAGGGKEADITDTNLNQFDLIKP